MLRIRKLKIQINTTKGLYGLNLSFSNGLNVIRGWNSSGKSTIFQSILYCLGMEELVGGRNEKAMQSVLKNEILNDDKLKEAEVIESSIFLEIENNSIITIERYVRSEAKDSKLMRVYQGPFLSENNKEFDSLPMYVHDAGSATDISHGFFAYLEEFLNYSLPVIQYNDNTLRKIYLQNIFPAFVVEQKVGWSDFLATIPYYNLRDKEKRAVEFILNLDSRTIEEQKQEIRKEKENVIEKWKNKIYQVEEIEKKSATEVNGLEESPFIINASNLISLNYLTPHGRVVLEEYINLLERELYELEKSEIPRIEQVSAEKEQELSDLNNTYRKYTVQYDFINNIKNNSETYILTIKERLKQIEEELYQNKLHLKLKKLGAEENINVSIELCPTCGQNINDTLLPQDSLELPMNIEENIGYLTSQRSMAESFIKRHQNDIENNLKKIKALETYLTQLRERIRSIKRDLVTDGRMPSIEAIERRLKLKGRVDFYRNVQIEWLRFKEEFLQLSNEWIEVLEREKKLPKTSFSKKDYAEIKYLNEQFIRLLKRFDYASKTLDDLDIPLDKLIPVTQGAYNIKFDSSASDLVRAILAFTCSLYLTSIKFNGNHPNLLIFDEPGNQDTATSTLRQFFLELSSYNAQSFVFASFKQSESDFLESTKDVTFNLIESPGRKFIRKLN